MANDLINIIRKSVAMLNSHIGSNGDAHLDATEDQSGFMSKLDKFQVNRNGTYARGLSDSVTTDILTLDFGRYVGKNWKNQPNSVDGTVAMVEVVGNSNFKKITYHWLITGRTYTRSIYGTTDSGWNNPSWINITPASGFTGTIQARRIQTDAVQLIEVRISVTCSLANNAITKLAELPPYYKAVTGSVQPYGVLTAQIGNTNVSINYTVSNYLNLNVYRTDGNSNPVTSVKGSLFFSE